MGEESSVQRPSMTSSGPRWNGLKRAASRPEPQAMSEDKRDKPCRGRRTDLAIDLIRVETLEAPNRTRPFF
jgi:hypothetical protein